MLFKTKLNQKLLKTSAFLQQIIQKFASTGVDESWQASVCMRVFSTLMSWSNENKSCMRVEKRELYKSSLNSYVLVKWEQELHESCMRVEKQEFV